eukprot:TRINITY_DN5410_c0_g2_i1.p1 TRINITY_DN5410_c0_g2~~TRINITY_DN5410_c0_g2_i1.p1  ORF type:complete len:286 (+),score=34.06 TRINITY_DN5410_c0_g2_i1:49-906(+)
MLPIRRIAATSRSLCHIDDLSFVLLRPKALRITTRRPFSEHKAEPQSGSSFSNVKNNSADLQNSILQLALHQYVPIHGWTVESLSLAAQKLGLPGVAHGILPNGPLDLINYFGNVCSKKLEAQVQQRQSELELMVPKDRLKAIIQMRLELIAPHIKNWSQAVGLLSRPSNIPETMNSIARIADDICHYAGDKSTNFDWYTKRATVAAIYSSAEIFMLTDASPGFKDTFAFVERRLNDVMRLDQTTYLAGRVASTMFKGAVSLGATAFGSLLGRANGRTSQTNHQA